MNPAKVPQAKNKNKKTTKNSKQTHNTGILTLRISISHPLSGLMEGRNDFHYKNFSYTFVNKTSVVYLKCRLNSVRDLYLAHCFLK